jgi:hypothetical protein
MYLRVLILFNLLTASAYGGSIEVICNTGTCASVGTTASQVTNLSNGVPVINIRQSSGSAEPIVVRQKTASEVATDNTVTTNTKISIINGSFPSSVTINTTPNKVAQNGEIITNEGADFVAVIDTASSLNMTTNGVDGANGYSVSQLCAFNMLAGDYGNQAKANFTSVTHPGAQCGDTPQTCTAECNADDVAFLVSDTDTPPTPACSSSEFNDGGDGAVSMYPSPSTGASAGSLLSGNYSGGVPIKYMTVKQKTLCTASFWTQTCQVAKYQIVVKPSYVNNKSGAVVPVESQTTNTGAQTDTTPATVASSNNVAVAPITEGISITSLLRSDVLGFAPGYGIASPTAVNNAYGVTTVANGHGGSAAISSGLFAYVQSALQKAGLSAASVTPGSSDYYNYDSYCDDARTYGLSSISCRSGMEAGTLAGSSSKSLYAMPRPELNLDSRNWDYAGSTPSNYNSELSGQYYPDSNTGFTGFITDNRNTVRGNILSDSYMEANSYGTTYSDVGYVDMEKISTSGTLVKVQKYYPSTINFTGEWAGIPGPFSNSSQLQNGNLKGAWDNSAVVGLYDQGNNGGLLRSFPTVTNTESYAGVPVNAPMYQNCLYDPVGAQSGLPGYNRGLSFSNDGGGNQWGETENQPYALNTNTYPKNYSSYMNNLAYLVTDWSRCTQDAPGNVHGTGSMSYGYVSEQTSMDQGYTISSIPTIDNGANWGRTLNPWATFNSANWNSNDSNSKSVISYLISSAVLNLQTLFNPASPTLSLSNVTSQVKNSYRDGDGQLHSAGFNYFGGGFWEQYRPYNRADFTNSFYGNLNGNLTTVAPLLRFCAYNNHSNGCNWNSYTDSEAPFMLNKKSCNAVMVTNELYPNAMDDVDPRTGTSGAMVGGSCARAINGYGGSSNNAGSVYNNFASAQGLTGLWKTDGAEAALLLAKNYRILGGYTLGVAETQVDRDLEIRKIYKQIQSPAMTSCATVGSASPTTYLNPPSSSPMSDLTLSVPGKSNESQYWYGSVNSEIPWEMDYFDPSEQTNHFFSAYSDNGDCSDINSLYTDSAYSPSDLISTATVAIGSDSSLSSVNSDLAASQAAGIDKLSAFLGYNGSIVCQDGHCPTCDSATPGSCDPSGLRGIRLTPDNSGSYSFLPNNTSFLANGTVPQYSRINDSVSSCTVTGAGTTCPHSTLTFSAANRFVDTLVPSKGGDSSANGAGLVLAGSLSSSVVITINSRYGIQGTTFKTTIPDTSTNSLSTLLSTKFVYYCTKVNDALTAFNTDAALVNTLGDAAWSSTEAIKVAPSLYTKKITWAPFEINVNVDQPIARPQSYSGKKTVQIYYGLDSNTLGWLRAANGMN